MNWQLLKNVNAPVKRLLLLFYSDQTIRFAKRSEDGESLYIADSYIQGELVSGWVRMNYESLRKYQGNEIYWTLFVRP